MELSWLQSVSVLYRDIFWRHCVIGENIFPASLHLPFFPINSLSPPGESTDDRDSLGREGGVPIGVRSLVIHLSLPLSVSPSLLHFFHSQTLFVGFFLLFDALSILTLVTPEQANLAKSPNNRTKKCASKNKITPHPHPTIIPRPHVPYL